ncbi:MAG: protease inhibitor I9 family protein, partial [Planctomycetota bacterium]
MTRGILCRIVVLCAVSSLKIVEAQPQRPQGPPNAYIVQVTQGADPRQVGRGVVQRTRGKLGHVYTNAVRGFSVQLPPGLAKQAIEAQSGVLLVEPDVVVHAVGQTLPTGVDRIEADNS